MRAVARCAEGACSLRPPRRRAHTSFRALPSSSSGGWIVMEQIFRSYSSHVRPLFCAVADFAGALLRSRCRESSPPNPPRPMSSASFRVSAHSTPFFSALCLAVHYSLVSCRSACSSWTRRRDADRLNPPQPVREGTAFAALPWRARSEEVSVWRGALHWFVSPRIWNPFPASPFESCTLTAGPLLQLASSARLSVRSPYISFYFWAWRRQREDGKAD